MSVDAEKEVTIMGLSVELLGRLDKLEDILKSSFNRGQEARPTPSSGVPSNVLDDIIDNLQFVSGRICDIGDFIVGQVVRKIHEG